MKNFVQPGNTITVTAPVGGVVSGAVVVVGSIIGIAATTQPAGADVEVGVEGVFDLPKTPADNLTQGSTAKITPATGIVGAAGALAIGWIVATAGAGVNVVRVRLCPGISPTATTLEASAPHDGPTKHVEHEHAKHVEHEHAHAVKH